MGSTEKWVVLKNGKLYLHVENDGPKVLRKGLEAHDILITPIILKEMQTRHPLLYREAQELLSGAAQS